MKTLASYLFALALVVVLTPPYLLAAPKIDGVEVTVGGAASSASVARTYLKTTTTSSGTDVIDFTGCDFGAAASDRIIVAAVWLRSGSNRGAATMSIAGEPTTEVSNVVFSGVYLHVWLGWAAVPAGTSGTVSLSLAGIGSTWNNVACWRVTGCSATALSSDQTFASSSSVTATLTTTPGGPVVAAAINSAGGGTNADWTFPTEDFEHDSPSDSDTVTGAFGTATGAADDASVTFTSGTGSGICAVAFDPL